MNGEVTTLDLTSDWGQGSLQTVFSQGMYSGGRYLQCDGFPPVCRIADIGCTGENNKDNGHADKEGKKEKDFLHIELQIL